MDDLDLVRSKVDIVELINSYVPLKKAGRNFKALCPFHSEKTPSFVVSAERQIFKCFGCNLGGDVFGFLMEYEKMTFLEALRFLADKAGIKLKSFKPSTAQQEREKLLAINHLASEFYHFILLNHAIGKKGLTYLMERGINRDSIRLFKLGYAPDSWDSLFNFLVRKKGYRQEDLEKAGLIIRRSQLVTSNQQPATSFYDRFRGRIVFPLCDHRNNFLGFAGRTLKPDLKGAKYLNTPETELYYKGELLYGLAQTKDDIKKANRAIVVEGEFDVISSYQAGVKNVVAIKGSALTEGQVNLIKRFSPNIVLSLDADLAGDAAVRRGVEIADMAGLNIRVIQPKYGKDPDECARHSAALWKQSVKQAIPVFDFYLKSVAGRFDPKSAEGKKQITEEIIPLISKITNEVVKAHYLKKLAEMLEVEESVLKKEIIRWESLSKINAVYAKPTFTDSAKEASGNRREKLEEFLLSLLLQQEQETANLIKLINPDNFSHPVVKKILQALAKFLVKNEFKINKFVNRLPKELTAVLDRLYLQDIQDVLKDKGTFLREFAKSRKEIEKLALKDNLSQLAQKIRAKEKDGIDDGTDDLRQQFSDLSKKLKDSS